jgi:hypothetical protein
MKLAVATWAPGSPVVWLELGGPDGRTVDVDCDEGTTRKLVAPACAGVGAAINDATRILGGALGVAVIGSIYASR